MSNEITIKLTREITHNDKTWTEITVREPTFGELMASQKRPASEQGVALLAAVSGWHEHAIAKLPASKAMKAMKAIDSFLSDGEDEASAS